MKLPLQAACQLLHIKRILFLSLFRIKYNQELFINLIQMNIVPLRMNIVALFVNI
jgi:hypothetical protein